jgi:hypothetical protein
MTYSMSSKRGHVLTEVLPGGAAFILIIALCTASGTLRPYFKHVSLINSAPLKALRLCVATCSIVNACRPATSCAHRAPRERTKARHRGCSMRAKLCVRHEGRHGEIYMMLRIARRGSTGHSPGYGTNRGCSSSRLYHSRINAPLVSSVSPSEHQTVVCDIRHKVLNRQKQYARNSGSQN